MFKIILHFLLIPIYYASAYEFSYDVYPFIEWSIGNGRSYHDGYQSMGVVVPITGYFETDSFFFDLELHRLEKGRIAGNYGIGWRTSFDSEMVGINVFYDHRKLPKNTFHQLGLGVELLSSYWDVRMNGYIPFGKKTTFDSIETIIFPEDSFSIQREIRQAAMWGMDIELGKSIQNFYLGVGPYFYKARVNSLRDKTAIGGFARASFSFWEVLKIDYSITYDNVFKTKSQVIFSLSFPLEYCFPLRVARNPILVLTKTCQFCSD